MPVAQTNPPSFETVWAILQELAASQKELAASQKETDRIFKENAERQKESAEQLEQQMKETDKRLEQQMKETDSRLDKQLGRLGNRIGEIVEHLVAPDLRKKFEELGLTFPQASPNADVRDYKNNIFLEIDVLLQNGDKAMLVEVKTKLTTEDVKEHISRLEKMREYADLHSDKRTFLGAVAGVVMTPVVKEFALNRGFFVIEPSGETFNITPPLDSPKEW
jgi:exonuclease VII large subunit